MTDLPAPFCPLEIDRWTKPLVLFDFGRLLSSELWLTATAEELRAALSLWSHAVRQKPAASLPDNPRSLAGFAGVPPDRWPARGTRQPDARHVSNAGGLARLLPRDPRQPVPAGGERSRLARRFRLRAEAQEHLEDSGRRL